MAEASTADQNGSEKSKKLKKSHTFQIGASLYMKEHLSDMIITLNVNGIVWRFPAHSVILAAQSEIFEKMLLGDFIEQKTREIRVQDMRLETLKQFIKYMYLGDANFEGWKEALDLLKVAHKYVMEPLIQACSQYLKEHIDLSNVCHIYTITANFNLTDLSDSCLEVIRSTACIILRSDKFGVLDEESVIAVISSSNLNVDSEMCIVSAILRWAAVQCCRQNKTLTEENVGPMMIPFVKYLNTEDINRDEFETLPQCMQANKNTFYRKKFCVSQHLRYYANHVSFKIMDNMSKYKNYNFENEVTIFSFHVVCPVFLIGINLVSVGLLYRDDYMILHTKADDVTTTVFKCNVPSDAESKYACGCGKRLFEYEVLLDEPVQLQPHLVYHLRFGTASDRYNGGGYNHKEKSAVLFPETDLIKMNGVGYRDSTPFTINTDSFWGVTKFLYLCTSVPDLTHFK